MAKTKGVGCSLHTKEKQRMFDYFLSAHIPMVLGVIKNSPYKGYNCDHNLYHYDIYCGSGKNPDSGTDGGALIFLNHVIPKGINFKACFIDKEQSNCEDLERNIYEKFKDYGKDFWKNITIDCGDNKEILKKYLEKSSSLPRLGLVYSDANGSSDWSVLKQMSSHPGWRSIDFLVHENCTCIKRCLYQGKERLEDSMAMVAKKFWRISPPDTAWQWAFLLGTNYKDYPTYNKIGFHNLESQVGLAILRKLNFTARELDELQELRRIPLSPEVQSHSSKGHGKGKRDVRAMPPKTSVGSSSLRLSLLGYL